MNTLALFIVVNGEVQVVGLLSNLSLWTICYCLASIPFFSEGGLALLWCFQSREINLHLHLD